MPATRMTADVLTTATSGRLDGQEKAGSPEGGALNALRDKAEAIIALIERSQTGEIDGADAMTIVRDLMPGAAEKGG